MLAIFHDVLKFADKTVYSQALTLGLNLHLKPV